MATYEYNDKVKFVLPADYLFSREEDDEGNETCRIVTGEYEDDDGDTAYRFSCKVSEMTLEYETEADKLKPEELLDTIANAKENARYLKFPGTPHSMFLNMAVPLNFWGNIIKTFSLICSVCINEYHVINIVAAGTVDEEDPSENYEIYENMLTVARSIRVGGKKLPINGITAQLLSESLELTFEEDGESIDVSPTFNFINGDETTTYEYTPDGMKQIGEERFTRVTPDEKLYPHYNHLRFAGGLGFLGSAVVVNSTGTEYSFIPIESIGDDYDAGEEMKAVYSRVVAKNTGKYNLGKKAKELQKLFHVNETVFDMRHDRECELEEGLMHRAYMMSALRSFAWTLADYCNKHNSTPSEVDADVVRRIVDFVASEDWLNYDDKTYCKGLCSGSDLHVYFVPDGITQADRKKMLPGKEDLDRVKQMKEQFPTYNEILSEVHSLDELRKDLEYIYPAVKLLWDYLKKDRNYDEALLGNSADIVYAWCALALAAKEPFFSEDGPVNCFFSQPIDEETLQAKREVEEAEQAAKDAEEWIKQYGKYVQKNPVIDFNGSIFVFSGLAGHSVEKDHPTVSKVIAKGGQYRSKVSGLTNYLVVNPGYAGASKIVAVEEQLKKGKNIKVILLEDLEKALGISKANSDKPAEKHKGRAVGTRKVSSTAEYEPEKSVATKNVVLPEGVCLSDGGYVTINNDWSIKLPADWVYAADCENSCDKPFASMEYKEYKKYGNSSIAYGDNCFTVFRADEKTDAIASLASALGSAWSGKESYTVIDRSDLTVTVSYNDDEKTTYGQYVNVETAKCNYTIQYFYTDAKKTASQRHKEMEKVLKTIVPADEVLLKAASSDDSSLTPEEYLAIAEAQNAIRDLGDQFTEGKENIAKYGNYLEMQEKRKKEDEERKAKEKAAALAEGNSEKDAINMYIILTNEKKMNKLRRAQDKFYEIYEDDFPALSKAEVIKLRKDISAEMKDKTRCAYYEEKFRQYSVEDRFSVSTQNLKNVSEEPEMQVKADWAIENSKEWYEESEYAEVRRLMKNALDETRKDLDEQFNSIDSAWTKFSTGREFLQIVVSDSKSDKSDVQPSSSNFQFFIDSQLVEVKLASKGIFRMSTTVLNCFTWYWGVTVRDIWEAAMKNDVRDESDLVYDVESLAKQAMSQIRKEHPETKVSAASTSPKPTVKTNYTTNTSAVKPQTSANTTQYSTSVQPSQPAKKEGCYIATAVYGSYEAPEVMVLRQFRDEILQKTAMGRLFVKLYYRFSPYVAERLKKAKRINSFVKSVLDKWVERLNRK